jgi:hypothetical protein
MARSRKRFRFFDEKLFFEFEKKATFDKSINLEAAGDERDGLRRKYLHKRYKYFCKFRTGYGFDQFKTGYGFDQSIIAYAFDQLQLVMGFDLLKIG